MLKFFFNFNGYLCGKSVCLKITKFIFLAFLTVAASCLWGKLAFADIKWNLDAGVTTGYDDNVTYVNTNRISDMVTRTSVDGGLTQTGKNDVFDFTTGLRENIYTNHSSLDNLAENLGADYTGDLNPYEHLKASDTFSHSVDPSSLQNAFGRINGNYGTYYNNLDLESVRDITEQWKGMFKYIQTNYEFTTQALSNSAGYNPGISTEYDFNSSSQATVSYDYRRRTFSPGGSSDANTPTVGWRQYLNAQWYVDLLEGADFIKGFNDSLIEPRYGAGLTHDVDKNTQLTIRYDKQYEVDAFTQDISNDWHLVLNGFHQFTTRLDGDVAFFTGQGKYFNSGISYKFIGTNVSAKYSLNDHVDLSLTYGIEDSISNSAIRNSYHNSVFAGAKYKF